MEDMQGTVDTSAPGSTASVEVFGIPEGVGYTIEMTASSTDGELTCKGSAPFDVTAGERTLVSVMLNCERAPRFGGVRVNGELNICAELTKVVVSPLQTSVGSTIDVESIAEDAEGDAIAYSWTSMSGSFGVATAAATTYTCTTKGDDEITITVSDDGGVFCTSSWTVPVTCVEDGGGTGGTGGAAGNGGQGGTAGGAGGIAGNGGQGGAPECASTDDCPQDGNECTINECVVSACEVAFLGQDVACTQDDDSSGFCDGNGVCVGCNNDNQCDALFCVDTECVECRDDNDCGPMEQCLDGTCVAMAECTSDQDCPQDDNDCTVDVCMNQMCVSTNVDDGESCNGGAGTCSGGVCELELVLEDNAPQTSSWRALPKLCIEGNFDSVENTYECITPADPPQDIPGGGLASATSDPTSVFDGCAVPSEALGGQLAVDVFLDLTASSSGGDLTTGYEIRAVNAGLAIASSIAELGDLSITTDITSGNPTTVTNALNPAFRNTGLSAYIAGLPATLTLSRCVPDGAGGCTSGQIDDAVTTVTPTTAPNMLVNFAGDFLLELNLVADPGNPIPLPVDASFCVFDLPGDDLSLNTTNPN